MKLPLILASSSPSRKLLLSKLDLAYTAILPDVDVQVLEGEKPRAHVIRLAKAKALKVAADSAPALVIGCDSVCVLAGEIVSKPETHQEAVRQLKAASGTVVYFYSGLVLYNALTRKLQKKVIKTAVHFKTLSDKTIERYLKKDQPYNCAGSIKAEGLGIILVEKMQADDPNSLIGLPLLALVEMLEHEGIEIL